MYLRAPVNKETAQSARTRKDALKFPNITSSDKETTSFLASVPARKTPFFLQCRVDLEDVTHSPDSVLVCYQLNLWSGVVAGDLSVEEDAD